MNVTPDLARVRWITSSYSGDNGGNCVQMSPDLCGPTPTEWITSSYSGANGGNCVEVAPGFTGVVPVRDSKDPQGPALVFPADAWTAFLGGVRRGEFPSR
jgi:Domain of unknown function (DUF397)